MVGLLIAVLIFFIFLYVIVTAIYRGLQKDTLEYDLTYLWMDYDTSFLKKQQK